VEPVEHSVSEPEGGKHLSEGINTPEKNDRLRAFTESMERSFLNPEESKVTVLP